MPREKIFEVAKKQVPDYTFSEKGWTMVAFRERAPVAAQGAHGPQWGVYCDAPGGHTGRVEELCADAFYNADGTPGAHIHVGAQGRHINLVPVGDETPMMTTRRYFGSPELLASVFAAANEVPDSGLLAFIATAMPGALAALPAT